ncbi:putative LRR receptor-like serine/threonine-protein kinase At1g56130 [Bidens hawaiensis]|uniref:putative LRR receptor-like serine/threonine-protein kinase At1g56130 n=1 Tax=Bidens hawaiensis TaxID=980011 RepID=UPI00404B34E2
MQGILKDGSTVAIKKTAMASITGKMQELKIICNVHHRHLIRLLGYCYKGSFLYLVNEYMENGSLDQYLYGDKSVNLNWRQRFEIIYGIARGLAYLHEQYHVTVIHRDIKTSNILLDNDFQPKIADFAMIQLLPEDMTHMSSKSAGSMDNGYIAPEYVIHGQLSEKVDTYTFGIVVLEIISGKKCRYVKDGELVGQNLLEHAWNLYDRGIYLNLMDDRLNISEYSIDDVKKIIEIALMCTRSSVSERPAMSEVVALLSEKSLEEISIVKAFYHASRVKLIILIFELLEISRPPQFLNNSVGESASADKDNDGQLWRHGHRRNRRDKNDIPEGALVQAKAQLVGICDRVSSDASNVSSTEPRGSAKRVITATNPNAKDAADLLMLGC